MSRIRPVHLLAIAVATVAMILSPVGNVLMQQVAPQATSPFQLETNAFLSMFPSALEIGQVPSSQLLDVGVGVPLTNAAGLNSFVQATSTPGSPEFRQFLTPGEFDSLYAPSSVAYSQDLQYFEQYGIHTEPSSDRLLIGLSGTADEMGAAFDTSFAEYAVDGATYYGPTSAAVLPSDLSIDGTFGLTNAFDYTSGIVAPSVAAATTAADDLTETASTAAATCGGGGLTPTEVQDAYRVNELISAGDEGSGISMAVVDTYDSGETPATLATNLATFSTDCGLASVTPQFQYPVPFPSSVNSSAANDWGIETALDMDWSHVMAQKANLLPVQTPDSGFSLYSAVNYLVATDLVDVISLSWGEPTTEASSGCTSECNASWSGSYQILHPVLEAGAAEGISTVVASGDCGADDGDGADAPTVDYPSSDEDATGIGGSVLTMASNDTWYGSEATTSPTSGTCTTSDQWCGNESSCPYNSGAAGGGWSPLPQPWYQTGPGITNKGLRADPDVGITVGEPLDFDCTEDGGASTEYGTSDGAPQWAGLIATADGIAGKGIGLINPDLYAMLRSSDYQYYFHQVTTGLGNGYKPTADWDPISGVGTPIASNVIPYLATGGYVLPSNSLQVGLSASATSGSTPLTVTFTATATGGSGTYSMYGFYWGNGVSVDTKTSTLSYTYTAAGTYAAQVEVFDSAGNSTLSRAIMITAGTTPTLSLALTASSSSPAVGTSVTFTGTATGGTSPYTWGYYFGDGTYVFGGYNTKSASPNSVTHAYGAAGVYCADATVNDSSSPQQGATSNVLTILVGGATGSCPSASNPLSITATATPVSGTAPLSVSFSSTPSGGTGTYSSFAWTFGDGTTGTGQTTTHSYTTAGTYSAYVTVTDSSGATASSTPISITVSSSGSTLSITATGTPTSGTAPLAVSFSSTPSGGTGTYSSYAWSFGDGTTGTGQTTTHTYTAAGSYGATVTVTDSSGATATSSAVTITVSSSGSSLAITASATPTSGTSPLPVAFSSSPSGGTGTYSSYAWNFGDGTTGTGQNPSHTYTTTGTFSASVTVTDSSGATATSAGISITVGAPTLTATATASPTSGSAPLTVTFTGGASGGTDSYTSWLWTFGDGQSSTSQSPQHIYSTAGTYTAYVTVTDSGGVSAKSNSVTVEVSAASSCSVAIAASSTTATVGTPIDFSSSVSDCVSPVSYAWSLGEGFTSTAADPSQAYTSAGTVSVDLTVTDDSGSTATASPISVTITAASVSLTATLTVSSPSVSVGEGLTFTASATPSGSGYSYSWSNLPSGCTGSSVAVISCTPTAPGTFNVTVTVSDSTGQTAQASVTVAVTSATSSPSSSSGSIFGLSPLEFFAVIAVLAIVIVALVVVALRPKRSPPPMPEYGAPYSYGNPPG